VQQCRVLVAVGGQEAVELWEGLDHKERLRFALEEGAVLGCNRSIVVATAGCSHSSHYNY